MDGGRLRRPAPGRPPASLPMGTIRLEARDHQSHGSEANSWRCRSYTHRERTESLGSGGLKTAPLLARPLPKGSGKLERLCLAGRGLGDCGVHFSLALRFGNRQRAQGWCLLASPGAGRGGGAGKGRPRAAGHRQLPQHRGAPVAAEASRARRAWSPGMPKVTQGPEQDSSSCCPAGTFQD